LVAASCEHEMSDARVKTGNLGRIVSPGRDDTSLWPSINKDENKTL